MKRNELRLWPVLNFLEPDCPLVIQKVFVFGSGSEALITTKDLQVYGLGSNEGGCLGIGVLHSVTTPTKIVELDNVPIKTFAYGLEQTVLALTEDGDVYGWGCNKYGQLGSNATPSVHVPILVVKADTYGFITAISCQAKQSFLLTSDGCVYASCTKTTRSFPFPIGTHFNLLTSVNFISCQRDSGLCFRNTDYVVHSNSALQQPKSVTHQYLVSPFSIDKVVSGRDHTLILRSDMKVYSCGDNSCGQLGRNTTEDKFTSEAKQVIFPGGARIVDIAAVCVNDISIALGTSLKVYIWGKCSGQKILTPLLAYHMTSLHHAMAIFGTTKCMHAPLCIDETDSSEETNLLEALRFSFDDPETCDFTLEIEGKDIHVQKSILIMRSQYFKVLFSEHWTKNDDRRVKLDMFSYDTYKSLLWYIYTDECIAHDVMDAYALYTAADAHLLPQLKYRCANVFKSLLTIPSALALCNTLSEKQQTELLDICMELMITHMTETVLLEEFQELSDELTKKLMFEAAVRGLIKT